MSDDSPVGEMEHEVARAERPVSDVVVRKPTDDPDFIDVVADTENAHPLMGITHEDFGWDILEGLAEYYGYELTHRSEMDNE